MDTAGVDFVAETEAGRFDHRPHSGQELTAPIVRRELENNPETIGLPFAPG
jgi:hypothetical protein